MINSDAILLVCSKSFNAGKMKERGNSFWVVSLRAKLKIYIHVSFTLRFIGKMEWLKILEIFSVPTQMYQVIRKDFGFGW